MIRDSFWTDSYIERLSPDEKLVFVYLLTNPLCNVGGIYEIRTKRIGFETGYDIEVIENILNRFERDKKILRHNDWIVMVNHLKNQSLNPSIIQGCQRIIEELPDEIKTRVTGWVQAGLLNLTILNLTSLNSTKPNVPKKSVSKEVPVSISKDKFGEFQKVNLTQEEFGKLNQDLGEQPTTTLIVELDQYIAGKGKDPYKDHYAVIKTWYRKKLQDHASKFIPGKPKMI